MSQNTTTRISDLPENIKMQKGVEMDGANTTYAPMNVHPNPYGNAIQPDMIPPPVGVQQPRKPVMDEYQKQMLQNTPQQTLPSRDIPMDPSLYQNDEAVQPNYIPPPRDAHDYLRDYEEASRQHFVEREVEKKRESTVDMIFSELQLPVFIGVLYFIFQMPMVNSFFIKYFSFLSTHYEDGNINLYGMVWKSVLFGGVFYGFHNTIDYLSNI